MHIHRMLYQSPNNRHTQNTLNTTPRKPQTVLQYLSHWPAGQPALWILITSIIISGLCLCICVIGCLGGIQHPAAIDVVVSTKLGDNESEYAGHKKNATKTRHATPHTFQA